MKRPGKTSRAEFRAVLALASILIACLFLPKACSLLRVKSKTELPAFTTPEPASRIDSTTQWTYQNSSSYAPAYRPHTFSSAKQQTYRRERHADKTAQIICRSFDPNNVDADTLIAMGVRPYVAKNILRYREAGGIFRSPEDLQRIYGLDSMTFLALSACIEIVPAYARSFSRGAVPLDINSAGIEEWMSLPGIGKVFAERIVKFRKHLGGFHSVAQVGETYGLPAETMEKITGMLTLNAFPVQIDLNTASVEELDAHPYISRRQAETIVNYRENHGAFTTVEDAMKIYSLSPAWLAKTAPYLTTGNNRDTTSDLVSR